MATAAGDEGVGKNRHNTSGTIFSLFIIQLQAVRWSWWFPPESQYVFHNKSLLWNDICKFEFKLTLSLFRPCINGDFCSILQYLPVMWDAWIVFSIFSTMAFRCCLHSNEFVRFHCTSTCCYLCYFMSRLGPPAPIVLSPPPQSIACHRDYIQCYPLQAIVTVQKFNVRFVLFC